MTIIVGTYVSGVIQELSCDYNTQVKRGQTCAKIDPRPYQSMVDQGKANLAVAKAQLEKDKASLVYAKLTLERHATLVQTNAVSRDAYDNAKSVYDQALAQITFDEATIQQRQAVLDAAQVNLDYTNIISPVDGTVVSRNVTMGQTVAASFQTPTLFLIATDLTKMQVDANVSESDIGGIRNGNKATFTVDAYSRRAFEGTVTQVRQSPQTVQNVVTYDVVVSVDNSDLALKPGLTAATRIIVDQRSDGAPRSEPGLALCADRNRPSRNQASHGSGCFATEAGAGSGDGRTRRRRVHRNCPGRSEGRRQGNHCRAAGYGERTFRRTATATLIVRPTKQRLTYMAEPVIRIENVSRTYHVGDIDVFALRDVSLTVEHGEFIAIMGASGSGKSTLMSVLGCLDRPTSGRYWFDGIEVAQLAEPDLAGLRSERLGFVFQSFNLLPRTSAIDNVALPLLYAMSGQGHARVRFERARAVLDKLGLRDRERNTPGQLSGGQQQRVAIARALINQPSLLLADEPTGNLDTRNSNEIMQTLSSLNRQQGVTIIVVTHEPDIAPLPIAC